MTTVYDVPAEPLLNEAAARLEKLDAIAPPDWAAYARTGAHTEKPPEREDWWYVRTAAVLRKVYLNGPIGTERLSALFGGKRDRGSAPFQATKGSRKVVRTALQQLDAAGLVAKAHNGRGRIVTAEGRKFLDNAAHEVRGAVEEKLPTLSRY